ncbi:MAG TPA: hypothetical protein VGP21_06615, partial [Opitutaceae bacterium]|nr:hypothetical protein [Opitutaceae bacterium]
MRAASKPRSARVGPGKARQKHALIVALTIFVAVTVDEYAADQSFEALAPSLNSSIRAPFPDQANSSPPAGNSAQVDRKNPMGTATPSFLDIQLKGNTSLGFKSKPEEPVVRLPEFNVTAQGYSNLEHQLNQIDKSIAHEQSLSVPDKLDLMLNGGKILPRWIVFGEETAGK